MVDPSGLAKTGDVALTVNGRDYRGWKEINVSRSIESLSGTFELSVSERRPAEPARRAISPGDKCAVKIEGETVITGFVDDVEVGYDAQSHDVSVRGRDAAADLVDCSAVHSPGEWSGLSLVRLASIIAGALGVPVTTATNTGKKFSKFNIQQGETAHEAIARACRQRGVLAISDGKGGIVLTRAGRMHSGARLDRDNIKAATGSYSQRERFGKYIVKGHSGDTGSWGGAGAAEPRGKATDPLARASRPLIVIAEELAEGLSLNDRAKWEAATRAGRSRRVTVTVAGWAHARGLWRINELVRVVDDFLGVDRDLLIVGAEFTHGISGTETKLSLAHPDAFDLLPVPEKEDIGW